MRYFYEELPKLHVIAAGSLLEFAIEKVGVPVGRISTIHMHPLSFMEFLAATQNSLIAKEILLHPLGKPLNDILHKQCLQILGEYLSIGGMPEAVDTWIKTNSSPYKKRLFI